MSEEWELISGSEMDVRKDLAHRRTHSKKHTIRRPSAEMMTRANSISPRESKREERAKKENDRERERKEREREGERARE